MYDELNFTDEYKIETFLTPFEEADTICPQKFYFDSDFLYLPFSELSLIKKNIKLPILNLNVLK